MPRDLSALEQARISRRIAYAMDRVRRLERMLEGEYLDVIRFADGIITSAKIDNVSASKITTGTLAVGEKILISDGVDNRIKITRDEILISKEGVDVETTITETNKKDFVILSTAEADKLVFAGMVEANTYTHNLGYVPWFKAFAVDDADTPTEFTRQLLGVWASTTQIGGFDNPTYLMIFHRSTS